MKSYIINIGDELLNGQTVNSNAAYIGAELFNINADIVKVSMIGDDEELILKEFEYAWNCADLIIVSGGLGPTHDDRTLSCIVKYFETELIINESVLENIKSIFAKREIKMPKVNESQALVPKVGEIIPNYLGTAPGIWIEKNGKIFIAIPGVPSELKKMMEDHILPRLKKYAPDLKIFRKSISLNTSGMPESELFEKLGDLDEFLEGAKLAFLPSQYGIKLKIIVTDINEENALNKLTGIEQKIRGIVGRYIYAKNDETLEEVVSRILKERDLRVAVAESCTGGLTAHRLTNVSGSSLYFERGVVAYSNASKVELLKVEEDFINKYGAVSMEVARQMAEGVRSISGVDIGLAVTGIMGPSGATMDKQVGLVYIGICDEKVCTARKYIFHGDRILNKERTSQAALETLRRHLLGIPYDE